ncbi:Mrp/NBP35 family ATP-binding protein [Candidatus Neoehrlichia procyonis]|uniref:Iron-sulfur cluster carrier protein n=1 Tax=Candidatus Neoehrlichia procyonis str. RAC413 TaxID=1359163 RepID=A0A0F3NN59_9RICK|nr:Mrp/NBP35 family ATP-binding protein [Candidatus Neoehrlichia lotoris]KJV69503.1 cobQ/CobB/MinD/ParA nucleotide binding domain protein [Candidatus Neoehrlichia lotoris str. RAC413]
MINKSNILKALESVVDYEVNQNIVKLGIVSSIVICGNNVSFALEFANKTQAIRKRQLIEKCKEAIKDNIKEVGNVSIASVIDNTTQSELLVDGVKNIILIASGKGGVGKSTVALHIALSLLRMGHKVALVDADIYGPSIPQLLNISGNVEVNCDGKMIPLEGYGLQTMSIGYIIDKEKAVMWRGPMLTKVIYKLMVGTEWKNIDYLIVDTPPGTGDIHISLFTKFSITGVVLVSTPQELSVMELIKMYNMLKIMMIPIIGMVENMSYFFDKISGNKTYLFGEKGVQKVAKVNNITFLGEIIIDPQICESSEKGNPLLLSQDLLEAYDSITVNILHSLKSIYS